MPAPFAHLGNQIGPPRKRSRAVVPHDGNRVFDGGGARIVEVLQRSAPVRSAWTVIRIPLSAPEDSTSPHQGASNLSPPPQRSLWHKADMAVQFADACSWG